MGLLTDHTRIPIAIAVKKGRDDKLSFSNRDIAFTKFHISQFTERAISTASFIIS